MICSVVTVFLLSVLAQVRAAELRVRSSDELVDTLALELLGRVSLASSLHRAVDLEISTLAKEGHGMPFGTSDGSFEGNACQKISRKSRKEQERNRKAELKELARRELDRSGKYKDKNDGERVKDYFKCLQDDKWRLVETVKDDSNNQADDFEVWRLPGEKINRVMGVATVPVSPNVVFDELKDPKRGFDKFFPKVDPMFVNGRVIADLSAHSAGRALCYGVFKLPALFGRGSAPLPKRDFIWEQRLIRLHGSNGADVLLSAQSLAHETALEMLRGSKPKAETSSDNQDFISNLLTPVKDKFSRILLGTDKEQEADDLPKMKGAVRGELLGSGYFGKDISTKRRKQARVYYIVQADPKGILPKWLVNLCATKQAGNVKRLANFYRKKEP